MFIIVGEFTKLLGVFNLVERLHKLICEGVDPLVKIFLDVDKGTTDLGLPDLNQRHVGSVLDDRFARHLLDAFEFFLVQFVLLVKVDQSLIVKHAEVALPLRFLF